MSGARRAGCGAGARRRLPVLLLAAWLWAWAGAALAHKPSDSYLTLTPEGARIGVRWDIALRDLDVALDLDADRDGRLTWGEVRTRHGDIAAFALPALTLTAGGAECAPQPPVSHALERHSDGTYAVLRYAVACPSPADRVGVAYRLFAGLDPTHRGILRTQHADGAPRTLVLAPDGAVAELQMDADGAAMAGFGSFVQSGVHHILIGWDHLAFLLALLLPSVLRRGRGGWVASDSLRTSLADVLKIVTAFTLAHSVTLALAALQVVTLPPRLVESAIAASVAFAAADNVWPMVRGARWRMALVFGLVHGFGFASALADAGFARESLALGLLGFNLGVELGQLGVVAVLLPLLWVARRAGAYRRALMPAVSLLLVLAGIGWFVERAFDVRLLPA